MKREATILLRALLVIVGIAVVTLLVLEPQLEGRNANATLFSIYFKDPFLAFVYIGSVPFFVGLYQGFMFLGHAARNEEFSDAAVHSIRTTKFCAIMLTGFIAAAVFLIILGDGDDDRAGPIAIGTIFTIASIAVAAAMTILEQTLLSGGGTRKALR